MEKKILFLGLKHAHNDPRLFYREIRLLKDNIPDLQVFFIKPSKNTESLLEWKLDPVNPNIPYFRYIKILYPPKFKNIFDKYINKFKVLMLLFKLTKLLKPDIIQASDAWELLLGVFLKIRTKAKLIYDSHEDYYRQILDYHGYKLNNVIKAVYIKLTEIFLIRFCDYIFCTDKYLLNMYKKKIYGKLNVYLLRNFPYYSNNTICIRSNTYINTPILKIVYIGGVNPFRGVKECAEYVNIFNRKYSNQKIEFHVYSKENKIISNLKKEKKIIHHKHIDYPRLMEKMADYHVGICLWLPIKKFYRNLPLKNFDYMGNGLPIITSNFGNLKKYIDESGSGICINPKGYDDFEHAIIKMFNPSNRKIYSMNGIEYVKRKASFQKEGKVYLEIIKKIINE